MLNRTKNALRRVPGLVTNYRRFRFFTRIVHEGWWANQTKLYDHLHRKREWDFGSPVVRERNDRILKAVAAQAGEAGWGKVLEIGCADGIFTSELARRCSSVIATDISSVALKLAGERCAGFHNVRFERLDLLREGIDHQCNIVVAMDVFDCIHGRGHINAAVAKVAGAVKPGGLFVFSGCRLPVELREDWSTRWLREGADNLVAFLNGRFGLRLLHKELHPKPQEAPGYIDHVIALFRKEAHEKKSGESPPAAGEG